MHKYLLLDRVCFKPQIILEIQLLLILRNDLQHAGLRGSIDPLLEEADIDKDGKISLSEFRRLLRTASLNSKHVNSPTAHRASRRN